MSLRRLALLIAAPMAIALPAPPAPADPPPASVRDVLLARGLPADRYALVAQAKIDSPDLPAGARPFVAFKVADLERRDFQLVVLDSQGRETAARDPALLAARARHQRDGALDPLLARIVAAQLRAAGAAGPPAPPIPVIIRLRVPERDNRDAVEGIARTALADALRLSGAAPVAIDAQYRSFIVVTLDAAVINAMKRRSELLYAGYYAGAIVKDECRAGANVEIDDALAATRTEAVHATGIGGAGVTVAVIDDANLWPDAACFPIAPADIRMTMESADDHMSQAIALVANRWTSDGCGGAASGYAPSARILLANGPLNVAVAGPGGYVAPAAWAMDPGRAADVIFMSWHPLSEWHDYWLGPRELFFDYVATHDSRPIVFMSAGNDPDPTAYACGKGYNVVSVGNVKLDETAAPCDNVMSDSSSYLNPPGRELPVIAAPGNTHCALGQSFPGTSAATPVAASIAALAMEANPALKGKPELVRAILIASAQCNPDGLAWGDPDDDKDGAGLIDAAAACALAASAASPEAPPAAGHAWLQIRVGDLDADGGFVRTWTLPASALDASIKVGVAWNSGTWIGSGGVYVSDLDTDVDVRVEAGSTVLESTTFANSYEVLDGALGSPLSTSPRPPGAVGPVVIVTGRYLPDFEGMSDDQVVTEVGVAWVASSFAPPAWVTETAFTLGELPFEIFPEDRGPIRPLFAPGDYRLVDLVNRRTGRHYELRVNRTTGEIVDEAELLRRDWEAAQRVADRVSPHLLRLIVVAPDIEGVDVAIELDPRAVGEGQADWREPEVRRRFAAAWRAELDRLGIRAEPALADRAPTARAALAGREIAKLSDSKLVRSIELVGDPIVRD
jgi:hypothetical protein